MTVDPSSDASEPTGYWSSRIHIEQTATEVRVTGTRYEGDPPEIRATLLTRGRKFTWNRPDQAWVYDRNPARFQEAADAVRQVLADLDERAAAQGLIVAPSKPRFPPTAQQAAIIDAVRAGQDVAVLALAGTGKTTTMRLVAEEFPDKRITYIAFNRSIADEAGDVMPRNVTAMTSHAMAKRALSGGPLARKIGKIGQGARWPEDIAPILGITRPVKIGHDSYEPEDLARLAMATVGNYRISAADEIDHDSLPQAVQQNRDLAQVVLQHARAAWEDICSPNGRLIFEHDDYRKIWIEGIGQNGRPVLPTDLIIFDEAQDINAVLAKFVQSQPTQTIVVGDSYQSIYGFTGAVDALPTWPADTVLPLTQSWRFGPAVAAVGNDFLQLLNADLELQGNPALDTRLGPVDDPDAVLTRTNASAVAAVIEGMNQGKRVALVGGGREIEEIAEAAKDLQNGKTTRHAELSRFADWNAVVYAAENDPDAESLQTLVRLIERYTPDGLIRMVSDLVPETSTNPDRAPELVVSTAHKAKGREWDKVRIGPDFTPPTLDDEGEMVLPPAEQIRLAYVAVTRGQQQVELGSLSWIQDPVAAAAEHAGARPAVAQAAETSQTGGILVAERPAAPPPEQSPAEQPQVEQPQVEQDRPEPVPAPAAAASSTPTAAPASHEPVPAPAEPALPPEPDLPPDPLLDVPAAEDVPPRPAETEPPLAASNGRAATPATEAADASGPAYSAPSGDAGVESGPEPEDPEPKGDLDRVPSALTPQVPAPEEPAPSALGQGTPDLQPASPDLLVLPDTSELTSAEITEGLHRIGARNVGLTAAGAFSMIETGTGRPSPEDIGRAALVFQELQQAVDHTYPRLLSSSSRAWMLDAHRELLWRASDPDVGYPYFDRETLADIGTSATAERSPKTEPSPPEHDTGIETVEDAPSTDELQRGYEDVLAVFAEHADRDIASDDPVPSGPYSSPHAERVTRAFEQLKRALADENPNNPLIAAINAAAAQENGSGPARNAPLSLPPGLEPLRAPLSDAQAHSSWYYGTPQWQQVRAVTTALRDLTDAITAAPGSYLEGVARDVRARGFLRMVTARVSRVISQACRGIAAVMEKAGYRDTPAWLAAQTLHTRSADFADQLMGHLPPGWTLETLDGLRQDWTSLRGRIRPTGPAQGTTQDTPVSRTAIAELRTALAAGGRAAGERVTEGRAWQRLSGIWNSALPVMAQIHREVLRFEEDAADLGLLKTAWSRTCELASATARHGMNRLETASPDDVGAGWHAMRLLHHVAEQNLAHLRGDLPPGQRAPLGTYDPQTTSIVTAPAPAPAAAHATATDQGIPAAAPPPRPTAERSQPPTPPEPRETGEQLPAAPERTVPVQPEPEAAPPLPKLPAVAAAAEPPGPENDAARPIDRNWARTEFLVGRPPRNEHVAQMYPQWERELVRPTDPKVLGPIIAKLEAYDAYTGPLTWTQWVGQQQGNGAEGPTTPEREPQANPSTSRPSSAAAIAAAAFPKRVAQQLNSKGPQAPAASLRSAPAPRRAPGDRAPQGRGE